MRTNFFITLFLANLNIGNSFIQNKNTLFINKILIKKYGNINSVGYKDARKYLLYNFNNSLIYGNNDNETKNCEHIWCQKYFKRNEPMRSDLHHLYLSNAKLNSHRQDYKFSEINNNIIYLDDVGNKINSSNIIKNKEYIKKNNKKRIFEPKNVSKGKVSRAIAYFYIFYPKYSDSLNNIIDTKTLIEWNKKFPPSLDEIKRNENIKKIQNNYNPFIKYPFLIEIIFNKNINIFSLLNLVLSSLPNLIYYFYYKFK